MHKRTGMLLLSVLVCLPLSANAGLVGSINLGVAIANVEVQNVGQGSDDGGFVGGSIGWRFNDWLQWDAVEYAYTGGGEAANSSGQSLVTASNHSLGTGIRVGQFSGDSTVHPFASFGLASSRSRIENPVSYAWQWGVEWNVGVGLLFDLSDQAAIGFRYRYRSTIIPGPSVFSAGDVDVNIHDIGFELLFGN